MSSITHLRDAASPRASPPSAPHSKGTIQHAQENPRPRGPRRDRRPARLRLLGQRRHHRRQRRRHRQQGRDHGPVPRHEREGVPEESPWPTTSRSPASTCSPPPQPPLSAARTAPCRTTSATPSYQPDRITEVYNAQLTRSPTGPSAAMARASSPRTTLGAAALPTGGAGGTCPHRLSARRCAACGASGGVGPPPVQALCLSNELEGHPSGGPQLVGRVGLEPTIVGL